MLSMDAVLRKLQDTFAREASERTMLGCAMTMPEMPFKPEILSESIVLSAPFVTDTVDMVERLIQAMDEINHALGRKKGQLSLSLGSV